MSIHYNKQSQFELFPDAPGHPADIKKNGFFRTTLIVSLDNLVVLGIVLTMLLIVAFSLGVERGKFVVRLQEHKSQLKTLSSLIMPAPVLVPRAQAPQNLALRSSPGNAASQPAVVPLSLPVNRPGVRPVISIQSPSVKSPARISVPGSVPVQRPVAAPQPVAPRPVVGQPLVTAQRPAVVKAGLSLPGPDILGVNSPLQKKVDNSYTVQVASYANVGDAQRAAADLKKRGMQAMLMPKGKYTILCVGNFSARTEAESASRKLKPQFKDCVIRSL